MLIPYSMISIWITVFTSATTIFNNNPNRKTKRDVTRCVLQLWSVFLQWTASRVKHTEYFLNSFSYNNRIDAIQSKYERVTNQFAQTSDNQLRYRITNWCAILFTNRLCSFLCSIVIKCKHSFQSQTKQSNSGKIVGALSIYKRWLSCKTRQKKPCLYSVLKCMVLFNFDR